MSLVTWHTAHGRLEAQLFMLFESAVPRNRLILFPSNAVSMGSDSLYWKKAWGLLFQCIAVNIRGFPHMA